MVAIKRVYDAVGPTDGTRLPIERLWSRGIKKTSLKIKSWIQVGNGEEALRRFQLIRPDLVLFDLDLPDVDGKEIIRRLRERTFTPIIVISVRGEESEKICSLDTGADDYVTKPFGTGELLARIRAALRGGNVTQGDIFVSGDLIKREFPRLCRGGVAV